jgi:5-aminolevulinate synthase
MSNLQALGKRCPIMGKALAVQASKRRRMRLGGLDSMGALRAVSTKANAGKARLHTGAKLDARSVESAMIEEGRFCRER